MRTKLTRNKKLLYLIIYSILYGSLVYRYLWSNMLAGLVPDILLLIMLLFFKVPKKKNIVKSLGPGIIIFLSFFLCIGVVSAFINLMSPLSTIWGVRMFFRYYTLLYFVFHIFDSNDILKCRRIMNQSMLWCIFFCIVQLLQGEIGDAMGGITSGNGELSIYIVTSLIFLAFDYFRGIIRLRKLVIFTLLFYLCSMWAEIKLLYMLIPLIVYASYALIKKIKLSHLFLITFLSIFLVPSLKFVLSFYYGEQYINDVFDEEAVKKYTTDASYGFTDLSFNRNTAVPQAQQFYLKDPVRSIVGYGIGSGSISSFFGSWIKDTSDKTFYHYFASSYVLIETGWAGLIVFLLIYGAFLFRFLCIYVKAKDEETKYWSAVGLLLALITFLFFWYNSFTYTNWYLPFLIWGWCFVMIRIPIRKSFVHNTLEKHI